MTIFVEIPEHKLSNIVDVDVTITVHPERLNSTVRRRLIKAFENGYMDTHQGQAAVMYHEVMGRRKARIMRSSKTRYTDTKLIFPDYDDIDFGSLKGELTAWVKLMDVSNKVYDWSPQRSDGINVLTMAGSGLTNDRMMEIIRRFVPEKYLHPQQFITDAFVHGHTFLLKVSKKGEE